MPEFLSPGVYVEELPPSARPIAGVGTSTAGFVGLVRGVKRATFPADPKVPPKLITNFEEFQAAFGPSKADGDAGAPENAILTRAVFGFFNNGGTRCHVMAVNRLDVPAPGPAGAADPEDQVVEALRRFEAIDEIAIVAAPLPSTTGAGDAAAELTRRAQIRQLLAEHCERMHEQSATLRFAILDGEEAVAAPTPAAAYPSAAGGGALGKSSEFAAVYFPWIVVDVVAGNDVVVPPSGHIAGVYARVDATRGVYKAPGNEFIRGAIKPSFPVTKAQQDALNPAGVNALRVIDGGVKIYGARTTGADGQPRYVSTRRYLNFLIGSIQAGTAFVVMEPNDLRLRQRIVRTVGDFLLNQWRDGALFGATPKQAFSVVCDDTNNDEATRKAGRLVVDVGVAIVQPAEFVHIRIQQEVIAG